MWNNTDGRIRFLILSTESNRKTETKPKEERITDADMNKKFNKQIPSGLAESSETNRSTKIIHREDEERNITDITQTKIPH